LNKKQVGIIGVGGIGSWLVYFIHQLILSNQIPNNYEFHLIDFDEVENKNITYQYFKGSDIFEPKVHALAANFGCESFVPRQMKIENEDQLKEYDIIICCVDNNGPRKLMYEHAEKTDKFWMDLRAEGRTFFVATKHPKNNLQEMLKTIDSNLTKNTSCQRAYEFAQGIVQQGNKIVAVIASQLFLNHIRGERPTKPFISLTI